MAASEFAALRVRVGGNGMTLYADGKIVGIIESLEPAPNGVRVTLKLLPKLSGLTIGRSAIEPVD